MILEIFILLLCICAFLMVFGYYSKIRMFAMVGLIILFLLGAWIILYNYTGKDSYGLQYQSGTTVVQNGTITTVTPTYVTYNDNTTFWVGFLLSIIGMTGMFIVFMNDK